MSIKKLSGIMAVLAVAGGALAQQSTTSPTPSTSPSSGRTSSYRSSASTSQMQSGNCVRASQLIGSTVKSSDGQNVGQLRDIVVDPQSGHVDFAVISLSGTSTTSVGTTSATTSSTTPSSSSATTPSSTSSTYSISTSGKLVAVPWQLVSSSSFSSYTSSGAFGTSSTSATSPIPGAMTLTLNADASKLQGAPSFEANNWSTMQGKDFGQRAYSYFGLDWNSRMGATGTAGAGVSSGTSSSSTEPSSTDSSLDRSTPKSDNSTAPPSKN